MKIYEFAQNFLANNKDFAGFLKVADLYNIIGRAFSFLYNFINPSNYHYVSGEISIMPNQFFTELYYSNSDFVIDNISYKPIGIEILNFNDSPAVYVPNYPILKLRKLSYLSYSYNFSGDKSYWVIINGFRFVSPGIAKIDISFKIQPSLSYFEEPLNDLPLNDKYIPILEKILLYEVLTIFKKGDAKIIDQLRLDILTSVNLIRAGNEKEFAYTGEEG